MKHPMPEHVKDTLARLTAQGHKAYAVGGCVRDTLLGLVPHDWDIATSARPRQVMACFAGCKIIETGLAHGTVTVMMAGHPMEITTYRVDGSYSDHRRPDGVVFSGRLIEDLARRDFTINAMVMDARGKVQDFFHGREDLEKGLIRCVGDPKARFEEDALRILRALRFASRFRFALEAATERALLCKKELLRHVAAERVLAELCGMDFACLPREALPVLQVVIPSLPGIRIPAGLPRDATLQLAALLRGLPAGDILQGLRASKALANRVDILASRMDAPLQAGDVALRRLLCDIGPQAAAQLLCLKEDEKAQGDLDRILKRGDCYALSALAFSGEDAKALGAWGKAIGSLLSYLLDEVIMGRLPNERDSLQKAAKDRLVLFDRDNPS